MRRTASDSVDFHSLQVVHERGFPVDDGRSVALLPVVVIAPGVNMALVGDAETVQSSDGDVDDFLPVQTLDERRLPHVLVRPVSQSKVIALAPRPHLTEFRQRQRELSAALDHAHAQSVQSFNVVGNVAP